MLTSLSALSSEKESATEHTAKALNNLLNYCTAHPDAILKYYTSPI